jgi:hypothetical protein
VVADVAARGLVEDQLRQRMVSEVRASGAEVDGPGSAAISSFPFLGRLLVAGKIAEVDASLRDVAVRGVTFASVGVELRAVQIDRDALVQDRKVVLQSIGQGTAVVEISGDELSRLLGFPLVLEEGRAGVRVGGSLVTVAARVEGSNLVVEAGGLSLPVVEIPPLPLISCLDEAEIVPGRLRLTCRVDRVPIELVGRPLEVQL